MQAAAPSGPEPVPHHAVPDRTLGRERRLTRTSQFRDTYDQGRRWVGPGMVLWLRSADDEAMRLGVVASKKAGKAVQRVRAKRLLREAFRINRHRFQGTRDVVLVARRGLSKRAYADVERELLNLARKAGLLKTSE